MSRADEIMGLNGPSDEEEDYQYGSSDEEDGRSKQFTNVNDHSDEDNSDEESDKDKDKDQNDAEVDLEPTAKANLKHTKLLTEEENRKRLKQIKKSGVVYLSSIPPYMKPLKLRQILERFGEVGRIYLSPEDPKSYTLRVKSGGNRKKKFVEGWAEYSKKQNAKLAVDALNGKPLGGKKGSFYYDDMINLKYLPKFKWHDLTEQISLEAQERQEKLKAEIAQATRENRVFIDNVEKKERIERMKRKAESGEAGDDAFAVEEPKFKRTFDQKPVHNKKSAKKRNTGDSVELKDVLSKIF